MLLAVVRHAETDSNVKKLWISEEDYHINERGREQAIILSGLLKQYDFELIVTSDKIRAIETSEILSDILGIPIVMKNSIFRDRFYGEIEGMTSEQVRKVYGIDMRNSLNQDIDKLNNVERVPDFEKRVRQGFSLLSKLYGNRRVILVTHGAFARMFYRIYHGNDENIYFYNCGNAIFECENEKCILVRDVVNIADDDRA